MICHLDKHGRPKPGPGRTRIHRDHGRTTTDRGYGHRWQQTVRSAIQAQPWCSYCGSTENLTGDHREPRAHGGTINDGIIVACRTCNSRRGARPLPAFFKQEIAA